ncbi:Disease resistance protein L6 [Linum perenne]
MSHSVDSTNSPSLPSVEYEVFLSFRGPDTRSQITEILYRFLVHSKIHTFKDDDEMRKGEGIWPTLVKAINQSKVYVLILSKNYAHSKWCLNELVEIVEYWKRDNRHIILPIFYMVDPRDVRHQSGPYHEAFQQHEKRFDPSTIQTWKNALKKIGDLKGWHVKNNNEQVAISDNVSEVIWSHISKSNDLLDNTVEFVGIDDHIQAVVDNLSLDSDEGTVMVGIHDSGGIGKTTLATAVYNKISTRFDRCCFLENIRETQQNKDGILTLQKKLISNVLRKDLGEINDANEGRKIIRERVSQFKVLVVLDDVDNTFKFDDIFGNARNFITGSRFIATSRDIKIDENNKLQMHDHLRDMGRDIVRNENIDFPWKRSRMWKKEDIKEMLRNKKATNEVKGIRLNDSSSSVCVIKRESFMNMVGIRYLEASNVQLNGNFNNLLPNLRWLSLKNLWILDLKNLCIKNLVILDLENSMDLTRWDGWGHIKEASRLKVLNLSGCCQLEEFPEFPKSWSIEILDLTSFGCIFLKSGELNIGNLRNLIVLRIVNSCIRKIKGGTIGMVSRLRELDVSGSCENLEEVLVDVEKLTCLKILRTNGHIESNKKALVGGILPTSLKELSTSSLVPNLSEMLELETLNVEHCHDVFDIVPPKNNDDDDEWWKLSKLTFLKFQNTRIAHLPLSAKLLSLHIFECEVSESALNLAFLENLTELHVEGCHNLREIHGLGRLKSLITLYIPGSKCISDHLLSFNKVRKLTISDCPRLKSLITSNGNSLEILEISYCDSLELVEVLLPQLAKFPRLNNLTLGGYWFDDCEVLTLLTCLEELITLTLYEMSSTQVIKFSSKLRKLTYLTISGFQGLREIEGFQSVGP